MDAQIVRWRKYGKDRLYVTADDGTKLGYHDVLTGLDHVVATEHAVTFQAAITAWRDADVSKNTPGPASSVAHSAGEANSALPPEPEVPVEVTPAPREEGMAEVTRPAAAEQWEDLAMRRAGEMARVQAAVTRQNVVRSGRAKAASNIAEILQVEASELPSLREVDPHAANDSPTTATRSSVKSRNDLPPPKRVAILGALLARRYTRCR